MKKTELKEDEEERDGMSDEEGNEIDGESSQVQERRIQEQWEVELIVGRHGKGRKRSSRWTGYSGSERR